MQGLIACSCRAVAKALAAAVREDELEELEELSADTDEAAGGGCCAVASGIALATISTRRSAARGDGKRCVSLMLHTPSGVAVTVRTRSILHLCRTFRISSAAKVLRRNNPVAPQDAGSEILIPHAEINHLSNAVSFYWCRMHQEGCACLTADRAETLPFLARRSRSVGAIAVGTAETTCQIFSSSTSWC